MFLTVFDRCNRSIADDLKFHRNRKHFGEESGRVICHVPDLIRYIRSRGLRPGTFLSSVEKVLLPICELTTHDFLLTLDRGPELFNLLFMQQLCI